MSANAAGLINDNSPGYADPVTGLLSLSPILDALLADGLISDENHQILTSVRSNVPVSYTHLTLPTNREV